MDKRPPQRTGLPSRELLYGRQSVCETLRAGRRKVHRIFLAEGIKPAPGIDEIVALANRAKVDMVRIDKHKLDQMTDSGHHQSCAAETSEYPYVPFYDLLQAIKKSGAPGLVLILDHIQDPQNLGSILRTADCAGVHGIILPADRAAPVTPAAVRASSGSAEHVQVVMVPNLVHLMGELKEESYWIAGLDATAPDAKPFTEADLRGPLGLVLGSEGEGLQRLVRETCDFLVKLPILGHVGSLNAGVAAGIAIYEALRQRGKKG